MPSWSPVELAITSFTTKDGTTEFLPESGVTVVVGPNNSGKSQLLREIISLLSSKHPNTVKAMLTLADLEVRRGGDDDGLFQWLEPHGAVRGKHAEGNETVAIPNVGQQQVGDVVRAWNSDDGLGVLASASSPFSWRTNG